MNITELSQNVQLDIFNRVGDDRSRLVCKEWKDIFDEYPFEGGIISLLKHINLLKESLIQSKIAKVPNLEASIISVGFRFLDGSVISKIETIQSFVLKPKSENLLTKDSSEEEKCDSFRAVFTLIHSPDKASLIDRSLLEDKTFFRFVMKVNPQIFRSADDDLKRDKELILEFASPGFPYDAIDKSLKNDDQFAYALWKKDSRSIRGFNSGLFDDLDFCREVLKRDPEWFHYMHNTLEKYPEFSLEMVTQYPFALKMLPQSLKLDKDFVLEAVSRNGMVLQYNLINALYKDLDIILAAVKQNPEAYKFVPDALKQNPEILQAAGLS